MVLSTTNQNEKEVTTTSPPRGPLFKDHLRDRRIRPFKISLNRSYIIKTSIPNNFSRTLRYKLIHSTRTSTEKHYQIHWKMYIRFCNNKNLPINKTSVYEIFNSLIDRKLAYGSLLQYRSVLTKPLKFLIPELNLLEDIYIKDLLSSAINELLQIFGEQFWKFLEYKINYLNKLFYFFITNFC